jgi:hypothetical protein
MTLREYQEILQDVIVNRWDLTTVELSVLINELEGQRQRLELRYQLHKTNNDIAATLDYNKGEIKVKKDVKKAKVEKPMSRREMAVAQRGLAFWETVSASIVVAPVGVVSGVGIGIRYLKRYGLEHIKESFTLSESVECNDDCDNCKYAGDNCPFDDED